LRLGKRDRDPGLFACQDFLTFKVAPIRNDVQIIAAQRGFRSLRLVASCDLSVPTLVTSCATIRWFVVSTAIGRCRPFGLGM
jgi:hypothetical protein